MNRFAWVKKTGHRHKSGGSLATSSLSLSRGHLSLYRLGGGKKGDLTRSWSLFLCHISLHLILHWCACDWPSPVKVSRMRLGFLQNPKLVSPTALFCTSFCTSYSAHIRVGIWHFLCLCLPLAGTGGWCEQGKRRRATLWLHGEHFSRCL